MFKNALLTLILCSAVFACRHPVYYTPQISEKEQVKSNTRIAIMPCNLFYENRYSKSESNKRKIQDSLGTALQRMGFEVVNQQQVNMDVDSILSSMEPFFNPRTGMLDTTLTGEFRKKAIQFLTEKYHVKSVVFPYLRITRAYIGSGYSWDGRLIRSFMLVNASGSTSALSLYIRIFNEENKRVYDNAGGIQLLSVYKPMDAVFVDVEESDILKDPNDLRLAIEIVLKPLQKELSGKK